MSIYDQPLELRFDAPIELKKGKTYLLKSASFDLPNDALEHIMKQLKKQTGAKFIMISGNVDVVVI